MRVDLTENGPAVPYRLPPRVARELVLSGLVTVAPGADEGTWAVGARTYVGTARIGDVELWIRPKTPIRRLFFLLGYAHRLRGWRDEDVLVTEDVDLLPAVAAAFARQADRATRQGLLQGYRVREDVAAVLRGRIRTGDQLRRRFGLPLPLELRYDDFTTDIPENQLLRSATDTLLRLPGLDPSSRRTLRRLQRSLADVTPWRRGPDASSGWHPSRLNARYQPAIRLAELILRGSSIEHADGIVAVNGFMLDMARIFEDFVSAALGEALRVYGGRTMPQDRRWRLDQAGSIRIRPDLVWYAADSATPSGVVDVKYKVEQPSGYPNADLYQLLAYCTRLRLPQGHLVYAHGDSAAARHDLVGTDITLVQHAIDLDTDPTTLLAAISRLATQVAASALDPWASAAPEP